MFYSNFDESKNCKAVAAILYVIAVILIICSILSILLLVGLFFQGERDLLILLLPLMPIISILYVSRYLFWLQNRVAFTDEGIIVHGICRQTSYPWDSIEEIGIFSISLFTTSNITPYFFFILSSPDRVKKYCNDLSRCFFLRRHVISVRYSQKRNKKIEEILKEKTKIYDWNDSKREYEWNPNREAQSSPQSPWPGWQRYEEKKRNRGKEQMRGARSEHRSE